MKENKIPENKNKELIDPDNKNELIFWADKFDITKAKLKAAINAAGNSPADVEKYLIKRSGK